MKEILDNLMNYEEPKFGSSKWLSCQAGMEKVSILIKKDNDIKEALHNIIAMTAQSTWANKPE